MGVEIGLDLGDEVGDGMEHATAECFVGQFPKPPLDQVQPGRARGGEMQVETRMRVQPDLNILVFVCAVVVQNHVHCKVFRCLPIDLGQEFEEFLMAVPGQAGTDHAPGQDVQRSEQRGRAVPLVVMGHGRRATLGHRQRRLGTVQRLHGRFLIHAQHDRLLRGVHVQPDNVDQLLLETRICGQLERVHQMRLQSG